MLIENMVKSLEGVQSEANAINVASGEYPATASDLNNDIYRLSKCVAELAFVLRQYINLKGGIDDSNVLKGT